MKLDTPTRGTSWMAYGIVALLAASAAMFALACSGGDADPTSTPTVTATPPANSFAPGATEAAAGPTGPTGIPSGGLTIQTSTPTPVPTTAVMTTTPPSGLAYDVVRALAPIERFSATTQNDGPVYYLEITVGLPSGCARYDHIDVARAGNTFTLQVWNWVPAPNSGAICTMIYGTHLTSIPLEDVAAGQTYTFIVNDKTQAITLQ